MHISSLIKNQKLRLWLSFVAGVIANALLGPSEIFYVYANELQVIFNVNKKQVEMFASIQTIGNGIGFVLCTFTDSLNPMCLLVVGFVFTLIGPTVLWVATLNLHMTNSYFIMFGFLCNGKCIYGLSIQNDIVLTISCDQLISYEKKFNE
ncbi:Hypothetical predicted protein [Mytilus galloprovincialis]|uniref:Nodulin-like domain-containing protein n=1 Tax=Mytilus galloprovincialis TaxID=29158 RepID=A0A8B6FJ91_MYTGA|nr:Hypothetical predicted protein [Mytilus galloprovincialis]